MSGIKNTLFCLLLLIIPGQILAQGVWQVTTLADMPEPVSNNAVATNGTHVFSFMGIDSTKLYSGIHLKGFRYDIATDSWDTIPPVPDSVSRVAGSASEVNGKIYVIGGYVVLANGDEKSSDKVFIYDPISNSYTNGARIPLATDDHVQCVWEDSLIYVITGWNHDLKNILNVQIYNPALDTWTVGTALPNGSNYEAFGAAGVIIDNIIYFAGGASDGWNFPMLSKMRTGVIDPANPTTITWNIADDSLSSLYRSGPAELNEEPIWLGGSDRSYNYNGIAYVPGTAPGVEPLNRVTTYDPLTSTFSVELGSVADIMDMRGIAQIDTNKYIIAGGMGPGQQVSDKTYLLEFIVPPGINDIQRGNLLAVYPNPSSTELGIQLSKKYAITSWAITDVMGRVIDAGKKIADGRLPVSHLQNGLYTLQVRTEDQVLSTSFLVNR